MEVGFTLVALLGAAVLILIPILFWSEWGRALIRWIKTDKSARRDAGRD
jgi:hypothetical protein